MIRLKVDIKGYALGNTEAIISQDADDTSLFLDGSEKSFKECISTLEEFSKYSILKLNKDKTRIIVFGSPRPAEVHYLPEYQFQWDPESFKLLGVDFTTDLNDITDHNILMQMEVIKKEVRNWKKMNLNPFGRIAVIRSLIISKIVIS
ncbi:LINE-1 reverse transcriptase homolog [Elysia marginata]|uniref:LINE-1 reverse transcriptase homolog n=1 Tax=Elysia marginata TaxID=1093978 RepID=A0AAV4FJ58_9GAST|nr:LINE-1 reverse transcriptase homolog [Elysia marginata]